jgi:hypothetical protein
MGCDRKGKVGKQAMEWLHNLIDYPTRSGHVVHLDLLGVEFGRRFSHAGESLIEREGNGILDEPLQPGDRDAKAMEASWQTFFFAMPLHLTSSTW